jgi:hypothetical protein
MSYDIIIRFPSKKLADEFAGQMSDGFGEGLCDFSFFQQKPGTKGDKNSDFIKVKEGDTPVYFVNELFDNF